MQSPSTVLAIDQGTTSTRAIIYDTAGRCLSQAFCELPQHYPKPGWVEHDAEEIWQSVVRVVPQALASAHLEARQLAAIGLTNQRETIVLWERGTGCPVTPAIVWQDRRTVDFCRQRRADEPWITERTGLVLDPYFSATKLRWLLDQDPALRARAEAGELACGTIDSFLIGRLTGGRVHATDGTNASRTLLLNLATVTWDEELLRYFKVPRCLLPEVLPSAADFGRTQGLSFLPDGLAITGVAGDQQAALFGHGGFTAGDAKCTYGTGAFFLLHLGNRRTPSRHRLLTTLAAMTDPQPQYALEGSVFIAGAAVQWLRDGLQLFSSSADVEPLANRADPAQPLVFVPALSGLGAPYWIPEAKGVLLGVTRGTTAADLTRAALEGVAHQVADLIEAADKDAGTPLQKLCVDGGMVQNRWFLQCQANILGLPVLVVPHSEATARGTAFLAGLQAGVWPDLESLRQLSQDMQAWYPQGTVEERQHGRSRWRRAIQTVISFYSPETS